MAALSECSRTLLTHTGCRVLPMQNIKLPHRDSKNVNSDYGLRSRMKQQKIINYN